MDIEGLKRTAKDITSFSAKALLVYEMTQVGGQVQTLEAADISSPENPTTDIVYPTPLPVEEVWTKINNPEQESGEYLSVQAQFLEIPAFDITTPQENTEEKQVAAQNILSAWLKLTAQTATSEQNGFYNSDIESGVKQVTVNGITYNVPATWLATDIETTIGKMPKNSLLVPYPAVSGDLKIAIMADTDGDNSETSVGQQVVIVNGKAVAIPTRFDKEGIPIAVMEFFATESGELQPREVAVEQGIVTSFDSNVRNPQNPTEIIGTIQKGTKLSLIGDPQPVFKKNFQVVLGVTPEGQVAYFADTIFERVDNTTDDANSSGGQEQATSPEAFWANYHWQSGDIVKVNKTGAGNPNNASKYWNLSITRNGVVYENLPVTGQRYGGQDRAVGMELEPKYTYPTLKTEVFYIDSRVYSEEKDGTTREMYSLLVAIPSQDGTKTMLAESVSPRGHNPGFSIGGGDVTMTPMEKFFGQIPNLIRPGFEIKLDFSRADVDVVKKDWEKYFEGRCEDDPTCSARMYAFNPENATTPDILYKFWKTGKIPSDVVKGSDGLIRIGALTQVIISPQRGAVLSSS